MCSRVEDVAVKSGRCIEGPLVGDVDDGGGRVRGRTCDQRKGDKEGKEGGAVE